MELTNDQKLANRAAVIINNANRAKDALKLFIEEGIEVGPDGQRFSNGITGWDGLEEWQRAWLEPFVAGGESPIVK